MNKVIKYNRCSKVAVLADVSMAILKYHKCRRLARIILSGNVDVVSPNGFGKDLTPIPLEFAYLSFRNTFLYYGVWSIQVFEFDDGFFTLEVPSTLNRSLLSINAIENAFLNLRRHIGRVWRWRSNTDQADRWVASGLYLSEKTFHRIPGCNDMDKLETALAKNGYSLDPSIEMTNT